MDSHDFDTPSTAPKATRDMHVEAETIAQELRSPSVVAEREGLERLRADVSLLPGDQLLKLAAEMRDSTEKRGLTNPLIVRPETDDKMGYPRFTGNEFVVLTNPFDDKVEKVRTTQEHSLPERKEKILFFSSTANAMVDQYAVNAKADNERLLQGDWHSD